ncbi:vomeronasal type-2 receptor 116 isoform X4 [Heterocephalus glaber]|uniref:Vomeronasal type-2 receptor 116 isoform X4 n=1 Tax=Heterocephalus glaber TaxID=10181 RepID=A0AAX6Q6K7_HETGA|nr:vomeronasal type-2 receptor 116 isoform X4 [Heterocephalus glaber]
MASLSAVTLSSPGPWEPRVRNVTLLCLLKIVSSWGYRVAQSFVFAVEEINRSTRLLPNLTLGFSIRNSGDSIHRALHETLSFLTGQEDPVPNYVCQFGPPRVALVGDTRSALSVAMARLLGLYKFPQVSYASTLPSLSDKTQFPSFLRTLASDLKSSYAVTQLVLHLGWSWVIILAQDDDFGQQAGALAARELGEADICIEFHVPVPSQHSPEKINAVVQKMQTSTATGVLVFLSNSNFKLILQSLLGFSLLGQVWVSEGLLHTALALAMPGISQLLHPLRKVRFQTPDGTHIMFDANGDLVTTYDVFQGQQSPKGQFHFVRIGTMDPHRSSEDRIMIRLKDGVQWGGCLPTLCWVKSPLCSKQQGLCCRPANCYQVPSSVCSTSCEPGSSQIPQQGAPHCCFECRPCPEGQFTDQRDMKSCRQCPKEQYPSQARDRCLPRTETFLAFDEPLGLALTSVALALAGLACLVLGVFLRFRDTPVVRANNRALSYVLLVSLALCALSPLLFLGRPSPTTCLLRQTTFAVVFTVAVSCVLAKTLTVVLAFRVTRPGQRIRMCLGPNTSSFVVLGALVVQVVLCGIRLGTSPPFPHSDTASEAGRLVLLCQEGSGVAFSCVLGYLGLLAVGTFSVAFLARGLPDAFNETKFLTFSMLLFCSVWTAFLPLYHSARGKATVAVEVFSILASTAGLLGGIFLPKCYLILLKPERNTLAGLRLGHQAQSAPFSRRNTDTPRLPAQYP